MGCLLQVPAVMAPRRRVAMGPLWLLMGMELPADISRDSSRFTRGVQARHMALASWQAQSPLQEGGLAALEGCRGAQCRAGCS